MKLFLVKLRCLEVYVIDEDPSAALKQAQKYADDNGIGFISDRKMQCIELLADTQQGIGAPTPLCIAPQARIPENEEERDIIFSLVSERYHELIRRLPTERDERAFVKIHDMYQKYKYMVTSNSI